MHPMHVYEVRPRKDHRGVHLISDGAPISSTDQISGFARTTKMKTLMILLMASALTFGGCASGAKFNDYAAKLPAPKQGDGRIWFFRPQKILGAAVQPTVYLNGQAVGTAKPGGFFHVDRPAGFYEVKCTTEWSDSTSFTLARHSTKYIRLIMVPGLLVGHVLPREESPTNALEDLQTLNAN